MIALPDLMISQENSFAAGAKIAQGALLTAGAGIEYLAK